VLGPQFLRLAQTSDDADFRSCPYWERGRWGPEIASPRRGGQLISAVNPRYQVPTDVTAPPGRRLLGLRRSLGQTHLLAEDR
jgi:hypothetical protein